MSTNSNGSTIKTHKGPVGSQVFNTTHNLLHLLRHCTPRIPCSTCINTIVTTSMPCRLLTYHKPCAYCALFTHLLSWVVFSQYPPTNLELQTSLSSPSPEGSDAAVGTWSGGVGGACSSSHALNQWHLSAPNAFSVGHAVLLTSR